MGPISEDDTSPSEEDGNVILYLLFRLNYGAFFIFSDDDDDDGMLYIGSSGMLRLSNALEINWMIHVHVLDEGMDDTTTVVENVTTNGRSYFRWE